MATVEFTNISTIGLDSEGTVGGGFLGLIETLGDEGVLIAFGGFTNTPGARQDLNGQYLQYSILHRLLGIVSIFDIANQKWYQQDTTGDTPPWRYNGCAIAVSAPDKSSHSIYVFGGWGASSENTDSYVYVLSVPSFRWIRVTNDGEQRQRHKCHVLGGHTMLVVGGIQPNNDKEQTDDISGCDSSGRFTQGLGIFSLNDHSWKTNYDPSDGAAAYQVHSSISAVIGGGENGGATTKEPSGGFSDQGLGSLLTTTQSPNTTSPNNATSPPSATSTTSSNAASGKKLSKGAIAGIAIGVVILLCCVGLGIFIFFRQRRRQHHAPSPTSAPLGHPGELNAVTPPTEMAEYRNGNTLPDNPDDYNRYEPHELMSRQKSPPEQNRLLQPQEMEAQEAHN